MHSTLATSANERALAGRVAGALWLSAAPMLAVSALPGISDAGGAAVLALAAVCLAWGLCCLLLIPWRRLTATPVFHCAAGASLALIAVSVAVTGAAESPLSLALVSVIAYCAYFFSARQAAAYVAGCLLVAALPLLYDGRAVEAGLLGHLWVAAPTFAGVGLVIVLGKARLVDLREGAEQLSRIDALTGLDNRRALMERLALSVGGRRKLDRVGLVLVDLDDFKRANTLHGHPGGDAALVAAANALRSVTRDEDVVARLGGDEFAIVVEGLSETELGRLAGRALAAVRSAGRSLDLPGFALGASAGLACVPEDADSADRLIEVADLALRGAKLRGKGAVLTPRAWQPESLARGS